jgi:hypothetical protein
MLAVLVRSICNRTSVATADTMTCRNIVQHWVAQAAELCEQRFDDPDAVFRVQTMLDVCRWMA